jgi:CRISPR/Cas system-associated endoribonuclease Cas2
MALSFNKVKGQAEREKVPSYKFREGENRVRLFGGVLARYIYWIPGSSGEGNKSPVECLEFNRETEKFDRVEKDWVKDYYPDLKAEWAYASLCYDVKDPSNVMIFNHKKKLFAQVQSLVEDLGDPTDVDDGWDLCFVRKKTGPKTFNVEYVLEQLKCSKSKGSVSEAMQAKIAGHPTIDEVLRRSTPEDIKKYLDKLRAGDGGNEGMNDEIPVDL